MNNTTNRNTINKDTSASLNEFDLINNSYQSTSSLLNTLTSFPHNIPNSHFRPPVTAPPIITKTSPSNTMRPLNIVTVNVQGLNDKTKQKLFLQHVEFHSFDIIGISELHMKTDSSTCTPIFRDNKVYTTH